MIDVILDGVLDTIKLFPYLFVVFLILEYLESKLDKKTEKVLRNNQKYGPFLGAILGGFPQCGFSTMAASLFSSRVVTMGTLIAVFLATSDEMLVVMLGKDVPILTILKIIGFKVLVGVIVGLLVDLIYKRKNDTITIHEECLHEHCNCHQEGILLGGFKHALKIGLFILVMNLLINGLIYFIGEEVLQNILLNKNVFTYFLSSLVGLIPNCCSSVIITELYLSHFISLGVLISGLLTGSGVGILLLFRTNKRMIENVSILSIIYFVGVLIGILVDIIL